MQPEKNLHAAVPPALLTQLERAAARERMSVDALVTKAIERGLKRSGLNDVLAYGQRHARERGLKPSDVTKAIAETRARDNEHGH